MCAGLRPVANRPLFLHRSFAAAGFAAAILAANVAGAAAPSAAAALKLKPVQTGVEYEQVSAEVAENCVVKDLERDDWNGWEITKSDGTVLRRFADTNGDKKVDLWCYFQYGVEVYRDIDQDYNGKVEQYRWFGTAGTRWGVDEDEDGSIDRWKQISAEETTAELVAALSSADAGRFARLLASKAELTAAGVGSAKASDLDSKISRAARVFGALAERQTSVGKNAQWVQFACSAPGVVPAGTEGATKDLTVYENAVAMFDNDGTSGQVLVGTIIKVGDAWRLVDLPSVGNTDQALAQTPGNFFASGVNTGQMNGADGGGDERTQELVTSLEAIDNKLNSASEAKEIATLNEQRSIVVERLIAASSAEDRATWVRQFVDTVSVAIQSGGYPGGLQRLKSVAAKYTGDDQMLGAYAAYHTISTEYMVRQTTEDDFAKTQEWYLDELTSMVRKYPDAPESGQAMLQVALSKEFEDKVSDAMKYYTVVAKKFAGTEAGERAAGAVRRLDSEGKLIELRGTTIDGKQLDVSSLRGRPVVIHYWASWCEPCKNDMKLLRRLQAQYAKEGLQLVGVNIDPRRADAEAFLTESKLSWPQLFAEGGLERSPLATQYGVQILPTMMLVDPAGKVARHNVRAAELANEIDRVLKK